MMVYKSNPNWSQDLHKVAVLLGFKEEIVPLGGELYVLKVIASWPIKNYVVIESNPLFKKSLYYRDITVDYPSAAYETSKIRPKRLSFYVNALKEFLLLVKIRPNAVISVPKYSHFVAFIYGLLFRIRTYAIFYHYEPRTYRAHTLPIHILTRMLTILEEKITGLYFRRCKKIILMSQTPTNDLLKYYGVSNEQIFVAGGAIDTPSLREVEDVQKRGDCIYVGRLGKSPDLPKIWQKIINKMPMATLTVIGPYDKDTQWIVDELRRLNVTVLGAIEHSKVITHIREHKLLIHPSLYEAWCIVIAEAMSNAVIPIAWSLPALKEVWGASPVVLIQSNNIDDFVENICTLLLSDEWKTAGIKCYEWIRKRFSWADTSNRIWNIVTDV